MYIFFWHIRLFNPLENCVAKHFFLRINSLLRSNLSQGAQSLNHSKTFFNRTVIGSICSCEPLNDLDTQFT